MRSEPEAGYLAEVFISHQGEGTWVGRRQLFVRLAGCSQHCSYCDTPKARVKQPSYWLLRPGAGPSHRLPNPVTVTALLARLKKMLADGGPVHSIALTGGEPTEQPEFLAGLINGLKKNLKNIKILLETNGLEGILNKREISMVDFVSLDIKLSSATKQPLKLNHYRRILPLYRQKQGCVKLVFSPRTKKQEIVLAAALASSLKPDWDLILQPMTGPSWRTPRLAAKLEQVSRAVVAIHAGARLLPQIHPSLGIR
jgi:7-carboxy-7-deazaguanine synthase